jgi:type I restriction enzyme M protein
MEPFSGKIYDPACGSGGMFVQSARFVDEHRQGATDKLSVYGQERVGETVNLCRMNLAVHGLGGQVRQGNTYYEDPYDAVGQFDYVMANPPFNVNKIDKTKLVDDPRFPLGLPKADNGNYLWIQLFHSSLSEKGRAGFVMANSAADASGSELEIRRKILEDKSVDVIVSIGSNFFYTVTLPCTLWFFDKGKRATDRADSVLFIDARKIFNQIDRAHRDFKPEQIEFLANIVRLHRGEKPELVEGSDELMADAFRDGRYEDVAGLCKVATLAEIEAQGWSLNPGRYVGVEAAADDDFVFTERLAELNSELDLLNLEAVALQHRISEGVAEMLK